MDFAGLMRAAISPPWQGGLGLTPQVFWGLTPQELRLMLGRDTAPQTMTAARMSALMAKYPDQEKGA